MKIYGQEVAYEDGCVFIGEDIWALEIQGVFQEGGFLRFLEAIEDAKLNEIYFSD